MNARESGGRDRRAYELVRRAYEERRLVEAIGRRSGVREGDLPDLMQRVVLIMFAKYWQVESGCERGYLAQVARREARHLCRTYQRRAETLGETCAEFAAAMQPDECVASKRLVERLLTLMDNVPERVREVWVSHVVDGESCQDVADATGVPLGTVKSRLRRGWQSVTDDVVGELSPHRCDGVAVVAGSRRSDEQKFQSSIQDSTSGHNPALETLSPEALE